MRILITGANGNVARELVNVLGKKYDLYPASHADLDITSPQEVNHTLSWMRPALVINTAALTDVDGCESNLCQAIEVNGLGPLYLASACKTYASVLIHFSTEMIFDGLKPIPYVETDSVNPLLAYGLTKYLGEQNIKRTGQEYAIFRTSWLFGGGTPKFVDRFLDKAGSESIIQVAADQVGSPTYIPDIAQAVKHYLESPEFGIFHLANSGKASRLDMACFIKNELSLDCNLSPVSYQELKIATYRPPNAVLTSLYRDKYPFLQLRPWQEALREYLTLKK